jgi:hypothetical protein
MLRLAAATAVSLGREATIIAWTGESAKSGELRAVGQLEKHFGIALDFFLRMRL